jgi:glycosyltransferase involved in cell wall biosynthesis
VRLLVAIPVFNERQYVQHVIQRVRSFWPDVLVVDDGSTDGTDQILRQTDGIHLIRHENNRGYGQSIIDALAHADAGGYDWVITMDCDEQHEPERIPDFIEAIKTDRWDLISGSRYLQPSAEDDLPPTDRRSINGKITGILNDLLKLKLTDAFCGFKAHRTSAMRRLQLNEAGYAFPMQLWPQAARADLRITEIPVRLIYNDPTRHFGGVLDDAEFRLRHYLNIFRAELDRPATPAQAKAAACCGCCCE